MLDIISNGHGTDILLGLLALGAAALLTMAGMMAGVWHRLREGVTERKELRDIIATVRADQRFYLTAKSLGPIYEKINDVGKDVTETRAEMRGVTEQLRIINRHLMNLS